MKRSVAIGLTAGVVALYAAFGTPLAGASSAEEPSVKPDLAGEWQLNPELSEDARAKMRDARGGRGGGGGPRGGGPWGGRGPRGGGGMRGGGPREGGGGAMGGGMGAFLQPAETLTITQDGREILIDDGVNPALRVRPDGEATKTDSGASEVKARWKGTELVTEAKVRNGVKLTTAYMLDSQKKQLSVTTMLEGGRFAEPLTVRRVYDAVRKEPSRQ